MFAICSIGLSLTALHLTNTLSQVKSAKDIALPKINGESVYAAIACNDSIFAEIHLPGRNSAVDRICAAIACNSNLFAPEGYPVLLSRIYVLPTFYSKEDDDQMIYPRSVRLTCESNKGEMTEPVEGIGLGSADWQGAEFSAERTREFTISKQWFKKEKIFIFGNIEKKQNGYEISSPLFLPFVITLNPETVVESCEGWATLIKFISLGLICSGILSLEPYLTMPLRSIKRLCSCLPSNSQETYSLIRNAYHTKSYSGKQDEQVELVLRV